MTEDIIYCSSSYLQFRTIVDKNKCFSNKFPPNLFTENLDREKVCNSNDLEILLKRHIENACQNGRAALALSGGIDSAILAKFMPKGSTSYTFKCIVPDVDVADETIQAKKYAEECGLIHKTIEIYWEDFEKYAPILMKHKGFPIHSIEIQIYKAALKAKDDGFDTLIFGESADVNYGGQDGLLSRDWTTDEYIKRYSYLMPDMVLKEYEIIREPFERYSNNGYINAHEFNRHVYYLESMGSYINACECAGIKFIAPFSKTYLGIPLDLDRIRNGENKYIVREVFERLYPDFEIPQKTPMPRPMYEWFNSWGGVKREEFIENCHIGLTGDQKWQLWCLERFLDLINL